MWGAIAGIVGAGLSLFGSSKKAKYEKRASEQNAKITKLQNFQQRREFVADARRAIAMAGVSDYVGGLEGESSRSLGSQAILQTQARTNIAEANEINRLGGKAASYTSKAYKYGNIAAIGSTVASIGSQFITPQSSYSDLNEIDMNTLPKRR